MKDSWERANTLAKLDEFQGKALSYGLYVTLLGMVSAAGVLTSPSEMPEKTNAATEIQAGFQSSAQNDSQTPAVASPESDTPSSDKTAAYLFSLVMIGGGLASMSAGAASAYTVKKLDTPNP